MLVLKRRYGEMVQVGPDVTVAVLRMQGESAFIAITAAPHLRISRSTMTRADLEAARAAIDALLATQPETLLAASR